MTIESIIDQAMHLGSIATTPRDRARRRKELIQKMEAKIKAPTPVVIDAMKLSELLKYLLQHGCTVTGSRRHGERE